MKEITTIIMFKSEYNEALRIIQNNESSKMINALLTLIRNLNIKEVAQAQLAINLSKPGIFSLLNLFNDTIESIILYFLRDIVVRKLSVKLVCEMAYNNEKAQSIVCEMNDFSCFFGKVYSIVQ